MIQSSSPGLVAILGSGELSDSMAEAHRTIMARLAEPKPVFIDTPAGFETNVDQIAQKAVSYFRRNFDMELALAHYQAMDAPPSAVAAAVTAIQQANYLFAGPGSPTYAVRAWRDRQVWRALLDRWRSGASLVFASAAALTLGRYTLPVYEIYKAGFDIYWTEGLNILDWLGYVAVVPHWNNASGEQHDTRFCFMGAERFAELEALLPAETLIIGVDEYTALLIDPTMREARVLGSGQVTLRRDGRQRAFGKGQVVRLDDTFIQTDIHTAATPLDPQDQRSPLQTQEQPRDLEDAEVGDILAARDQVRQAMEQGDFDATVQGLVTLSLMAGAGLEQGRFDRAERAVESLQVVLPRLSTIALAQTDTDALDKEHADLMTLLIDSRANLRTAKQYALADELRDRLAGLGYALEDGPTGTTWRRQ